MLRIQQIEESKVNRMKRRASKNAVLMFMLRATPLVVRRTPKTNGAGLHHTTLPFDLLFPFQPQTLPPLSVFTPSPSRGVGIAPD